jgi:hypothetical protein
MGQVVPLGIYPPFIKIGEKLVGDISQNVDEKYTTKYKYM